MVKLTELLNNQLIISNNPKKVINNFIKLLNEAALINNEWKLLFNKIKKSNSEIKNKIDEIKRIEKVSREEIDKIETIINNDGKISRSQDFNEDEGKLYDFWDNFILACSNLNNYLELFEIDIDEKNTDIIYSKNLENAKKYFQVAKKYGKTN